MNWDITFPEIVADVVKDSTAKTVAADLPRAFVALETTKLDTAATIQFNEKNYPLTTLIDEFKNNPAAASISLQDGQTVATDKFLSVAAQELSRQSVLSSPPADKKGVLVTNKYRTMD